MSIFSSLGKVAGGIIGGASKVIKGASPVLSKLPGPLGTIGTIGTIGGIVGGAIGGHGGGGGLPALPGGSTGHRATHGTQMASPVFDKGGNLIGYRPHRRRHGRGFSARDIRQTRRMLALVRDVERSCPKHRTARASARTCR